MVLDDRGYVLWVELVDARVWLKQRRRWWGWWWIDAVFR